MAKKSNVQESEETYKKGNVQESEETYKKAMSKKAKKHTDTNIYDKKGLNRTVGMRTKIQSTGDSKESKG